MKAMTRDPTPIRLLLAAFALLALALGAPAASLAGEATPSTSVTTTPSPTAEPGSAAAGTSSSTAQETPTTGTNEAAAPDAPEAPPQVQAQHAQGITPSGARSRSHKRGHAVGAQPGGGAAAGSSTSGGVRAKHSAPSPSTLTPSLPLSLRSSFAAGLPSFFIESFQVPPFLLPIFQAAGTAYGIPWQVLAAINEVETDYGRDVSVSSAGAEGWMQFLPSEWAQYGIDANGDGWEDPYNPADAIFAAARYLRAAGGDTNIKAAVFSYNHSQSYVESVMLRAQLLGGTPSELLGAITGLTEARFPVHAASHYSDGFATVPADGTSRATTLVGTTIYSRPGAPVIAVADGEIAQVGDSPALGHFVALRDAYGNTFVYAELGEVSSVYPVLEPRVRSAPSKRISRRAGKPEGAPSGPATAGAQPRSPLSEGAAVSELALGAAVGLESVASAPASKGSTPTHAPKPAPARAQAHVQVFTEGADDVYLHPLVAGVQVIAGTVLGHLSADAGPDSTGASSPESEGPHIVFQIRPGGVGAPLIDPKPILDGWVALEDTSIFRAKGENPFLATSPTVGQVLLESKQQLEPQVLHASSPEGDAGIRLSACARQDVQEGRVDKRVLAMLEYLSVSGLRPTASGLPCAPSTPAALAANAPVSASAQTVEITAVNGMPIAGHQGPGSVADETVRRLLMLEGLSRPQRIASLMNYPGAAAAVQSASAAAAIRVTYGALGTSGAHAAALAASGLSPSQWIELIDRLGEIPDPTVGGGHSSAAIPDAAGAAPALGEGEARGND
jgi:murein DD-endopeptidase MepM/ murein hydrolase activator NlpD